MRGTHLWRVTVHPVRGIIPAYAGNTRRPYECPARQTDHPRVCGEHHFWSMVARSYEGSSPRMRGTHHADMDGRAITGIIPAYAGNTRHRLSGRDVPWDHPRVCGEHEIDVGQGEVTAGIIPAYAGNTESLRRIDYVRRDHPRVCGEHTDDDYNGIYSTGSSPRMRGTLTCI